MKMLVKSVGTAVSLFALTALADPSSVAVYFGQTGTDSLASYCESSDSFEWIALAFVNISPEHDPSGLGYAGTNFAAHCAADVYEKGGVKSKLLSQCTFIAADIAKCQKLGKRVLLSIGGDPTASDTNYTVSSNEKGEQFADFLWNAFGPYNESWDGARPLDFNGNHVAVDGFDFDIEAHFDETPYVHLINRLRWHFSQAEGEYFISGAPQCYMSKSGFLMHDMITNAQFDLLFIQFYNNAECDAIPGNSPSDSFNYDAWVDFIKDTKSKDAKLFIGLPGSPDGAGTGYLDPEQAVKLFNEYKSKPGFGGAMIWDVNFGTLNVADGRTYIENIHDELCGTSAPPKTTTIIITSTSTPPATTLTSTIQDSSSSTATSTSMASPSSTTTSTTKESTSSTTSSTTNKLPSTTTSSGGSSTLEECTASPSETSYVASSTPLTTSASSSLPVETSRSLTNSVSLTTSTVYTTSVYTVTSCAPTITNCPAGQVVTETIALYVTTCPVTDVAPPQTYLPSATRSMAISTTRTTTTRIATVTLTRHTSSALTSVYDTTIVSPGKHEAATTTVKTAVGTTSSTYAAVSPTRPLTVVTAGAARNVAACGLSGLLAVGLLAF